MLTEESHKALLELKELSHGQPGFIVKPILIFYIIRVKLSYDQPLRWRLYIYGQLKALYNEIAWF